MFGKNPKRGPEKGDGSTLKVVEIFPTLQGEGPFVGQPAVFVRLGGCNLACGFCDTEFEIFEEMALATLLETVVATAAGIRDLVVITGGEPLRQEIGPLCEALLARGLRVQIETNGTLWRPLPAAVNIVCSPKVTDGRYYPIRPEVLERADALKFIISADEAEYSDIGQVGQAGRAIPVYVQPMDVGDEARNRANTQRALMLAQTHGYRLSLQTHKMLGIA
ncbi:MAG: 7-carboxy-7-deazaguanine synthase QueE [Pseudomonadota bacterium]